MYIVVRASPTDFTVTGADRATQFRPNLSNLPSVQQQPQLVEAHLRSEVEAGRLLGPLPLHLACLVQTSPIGLIPKPRQPGKWTISEMRASLSGGRLSSIWTVLMRGPSVLCVTPDMSPESSAELGRLLGSLVVLSAENRFFSGPVPSVMKL